MKDSFEKFRSLGEEETEVMANKVLETHGMVVMFAVDEIINCIDDPDSAIELLIEQGKSHAKFGDLSEEIFWVSTLYSNRDEVFLLRYIPSPLPNFGRAISEGRFILDFASLPLEIARPI